jgi:hypothetical protein
MIFFVTDPVSRDTQTAMSSLTPGEPHDHR